MLFRVRWSTSGIGQAVTAPQIISFPQISGIPVVETSNAVINEAQVRVADDVHVCPRVDTRPVGISFHEWAEGLTLIFLLWVALKSTW